jgi:hypothetical protein
MGDPRLRSFAIRYWRIAKMITERSGDAFDFHGVEDNRFVRLVLSVAGYF